MHVSVRALSYGTLIIGGLSLGSAWALKGRRGFIHWSAMYLCDICIFGPWEFAPNQFGPLPSSAYGFGTRSEGGSNFLGEVLLCPYIFNLLSGLWSGLYGAVYMV